MASGRSLGLDAVVIGGGFYGCAIAIYLKQVRGLKSVLLVEQEKDILQRASYTNQARVHNGYHYPRSFTTAYRSRVNMPRFVVDWRDAVKKDFTKIYAIARKNSKVTAKQFERFCFEVGAKLVPAPQEYNCLFESRLIEASYLVEEYAFDTSLLARWAWESLKKRRC
ncbi:MAG: FAD-dependent oxidoreductase [Cellvibrionaceae bacterium]|nr:FAD-dependent oxidoreductase [Cellvibrionaceae bacterium]